MEKQKKRLMIIGGSLLQLPAIKTAQNMGYYVVNVDEDKDCIGFKYSNEKVILSTLDYEGIKKYIGSNPIDGIITLATDRPVNIVAMLARDFNLNSISVSGAKNSTNKANMRRTLSKFNIQMPRFEIVDNFDDFLTANNNIEGSTIVKASDNSGKRGIRKLNDNASVTEKREVFKYALENSLSGEVLVEEMIAGKEYSVESITWDNETTIVTITNKYNSGEPNFVEIGHSQPADLSFSQYLKIEELVKKVIFLLGINNSACHTEIMINGNGIYIIEVGPRLGGDHISTSLVKLSTGVDMVEAVIHMALGKKPIANRILSKGASIRFILPSKGVYHNYSLEKDITKMEGFHEFAITKKPGDKMSALSNSGDRIGYVIFSGNDQQSAEKNTFLAESLIKIIKSDEFI